MMAMDHSGARMDSSESTDACAYEQDRQRHVQARDALLDAEMKKMDWPLERLLALRDECLRALIHHAKEHSPWHARRLRDVGADRLTGGDLRQSAVFRVL